jgi:hypothetical membrane protein
MNVNIKQGIRESLFTNQRFGFYFYILSIQYFVIQIIVASDWLKPYSLSRNTISDLGNTACGIYGGRYVCSPLHPVMDLSFITLGVTMIIGSVILIRSLRNREDLGLKLGLYLLIMSGLGVILVGLFPENTIGFLHSLGASFCFLLGNIGFLIAGLRMRLPKTIKIYTVVAGLSSLFAFCLFVSDHYVGLGEGGMERIVAYPQTLWLIIVGCYFIFTTKYISS